MRRPREHMQSSRNRHTLANLEHRANEPCTPSTSRRARAALAFCDGRACLQNAQRGSECVWLGTQSEALEKTLKTPSPDDRLRSPRVGRTSGDGPFTASFAQRLRFLALRRSVGGCSISRDPRRPAPSDFWPHDVALVE